MTQPLLAAAQLTKKFPGVIALHHVSFELRANEIHALCGENGAGKSTLIKLLTGIHPHGSYQGELRLDGQVARFQSIRDADAAGIAVITQEFALIDRLSVAENIFLGRPPRRGWRVDWLEMHRRATAALAQFHLAIDPETPVSELGIGQKQLIEIVRAMDKKSRVLVLDEPTAALSGREVAVLREHLLALRAQGTACIYISHKLDEVFALADRITVLRDGATVATLATRETSPDAVIQHMVGRAIVDLFPHRRQRSPSAPVAPWPDRAPRLEVRGLHVARQRHGPAWLRDISFQLKPGEVLGFGGLMGAGRTELLMHLFSGWGYRISGDVTLEGKNYARPSPRASIRRGMVLASEDRRRYGLVLTQDVGFNFSLSSLREFARRTGQLDLIAEHRRNQSFFDSLRVKAPGQHTPAAGLSGGNQQKVVLGKSLMTTPNVILLDEPTRGIDVGAKVEIYEIIDQLKKAGKGVILVSSELTELMALSDRIIMLAEGRIGGEFAGPEFSAEKLLAAAMGRSRDLAWSSPLRTS